MYKPLVFFKRKPIVAWSIGCSPKYQHFLVLVSWFNYRYKYKFCLCDIHAIFNV